MKKKFNFWLQLVTICLCICAIAVGVYSATTASITAGGKVAFTAHNCKVELTGYIYGHGVKDGVDSADGLPVAEEQKEYLTTNNAPITVEGGVNTAVQSTISIGENRWFTDMASTDGKPADIVIGITVKNITIYDITVSVDLSKVTYPQDQVTVSCDTESVDLKQGENVTFEFTLSFDLISTGSTSTSYTGFGLTDLVIPIYSTKYVAPNITLLHNDNDGFGWHIKMGTMPADFISAGESLRWKPFALKTSSGLEIFNGKTTELTAGATYYFVSEYVVNAVPATSQYGIPYCNDYLAGTTNCAHNKYPDVSANNYATSNLRAYLKSTAKNPVSNSFTMPEADKYTPDSNSVNFLDYYGILSDDVFKVIKDKNLIARPLSELYETDTSGVNYSTFATSHPELCVSDYFWAPSSSDLYYINGVEGERIETDDSYANLNFKMAYNKSTSGAYWLRTPRPDYGEHAGFYNGLFMLSGSFVASNIFGALPCFQITIPA